MARLSYPDPATLPAADRALIERLPPLNIFRMLSGSGATFRPFMDLIDAYLNDGALDPVLRELVILRVGHLCGSAYEIHQHERVSRILGMSEAQISAMAGSLESVPLSDTERTVLAFTDAQVAEVKVPADLTEKTRQAIGDQGLQQLILVIGLPIMIRRY